MPKGLVHFQASGNFHFLTFSCFRRLPNLASAAARTLFEDALERMRLRLRFVVAGQTHHANERSRNKVLKGHGFIRAV
jgi:putative transposase